MRGARSEECPLENGDIDNVDGPEQPERPTPPPQKAAFVIEKWQWNLETRPKVLYINLVALIILSLWAGLMWVTPLIEEPGTLTGLDGWVGTRDHPDGFDDLNPISRFMYRAGDSQCHQKENRTLIFNDNQQPFCSRDVAIYTLMAIGMALSIFPRMPLYDRLNDLKWQWLIIALIPIGIDGVGQLLGYWESTNLRRLLTGGLIGIVVGIALGFMLRESESMAKEMRRDRKLRKEWEEAMAEEKAREEEEANEE
jgi:uncharacterized membrane protein